MYNRDSDLYRLPFCPFIARRKRRCNLSARRCVINSEKRASRFLMSRRRWLKPNCTRKQRASDSSKRFRPNELPKKHCRASEKTIMKSPSDWLEFHEWDREYFRTVCLKLLINTHPANETLRRQSAAQQFKGSEGAGSEFLF